ncbi:FRAS1- extracellular matrix protein 2 [Bulinus truncatus]|nr:FRAS1- extracellular matrix protein 2 [Bulinus truncatus]
MFPVLTTQPVTDFDLALRKPASYIQSNSLCTSLLNIDPLSTKLRSEPTIQFYKNLDLKTCMWNYEKYFDFDELISMCGGQLNVDSQLPYIVQSYMSVNIPLHVSYIFHSPALEKNWLNLDLTSKLHLAFTYDTPTPWEKGINSSEVKSGLEGSIYPKSLVILDDFRLSVTFDSSVKFHGHFLSESPDTGFESSVKSLDHPSATFQLKPIELDKEAVAGRQTWNFISDVTDIKDYSGTYVIKLVPCVVNVDPKFNQPNSCSPQMPLTFHLPIRIQQVSDFVPPQYSGNTHFYLTKSKELWTSESRLDLTQDSDVAFTNNDRIYGRIAVDLVQNLANSYNLSIEKVFLCSGKDGYIPKFDPANEEYGCFHTNTNLQYSLKILDKNLPASSDTIFKKANFSAALAIDESAHSIRHFGDDGFSFSALPMYQGDFKSQWYLQVVYSIKSRSSGRGTWTYNTYAADSDVADRLRQAGDESHGVGADGRGTNIIHLRMDYLNLQAGDAHLDASVTSDSDIPWLPIIISAVAIVLIFIILMVALFIRQKRKSSPPSSPNSTITIIKNGHAKVLVTPQHYQKRNVDV